MESVSVQALLSVLNSNASHIVLCSVGAQSLLTALCVELTLGSFSNLSSSLSIVGCSCLLLRAVLLVLAPRDQSQCATHTKSIAQSASALLATNQMKCKCKYVHFEPLADSHASPPKPIKTAIESMSELTSPTTQITSTDQTQNQLNASTISMMSPLPSLSLSPTRSPSKKVREIVSPSKSMKRLTSLKKVNAQCSQTQTVTARTDYLPWTEYFLSVAMLSAMRSKDPSTQVGACIVNAEKRIVGIGYNGFPKGCGDDELPWARHSELGANATKYPYVCHAEMNAILNKNSASCVGCTIYVVLFPCNDCAKLVIQSGIKRIVFISDKYKATDTVRASKRMLDMAGVEYTQHTPKAGSVLITFPKI